MKTNLLDTDVTSSVKIPHFISDNNGKDKPSLADEMITDKLKKALDLVDIRVLDHIIVGGAGLYSFAERGKL